MKVDVIEYPHHWQVLKIEQMEVIARHEMTRRI